jgi:hypothetical protein
MLTLCACVLSLPALAQDPTPGPEPALCLCATTTPFGSCLNGIVDEENVVIGMPLGGYPDQFPGSATVVPAQGGTPSTMYVADLFSGRTHPFQFSIGTLQPMDPIPSPGGSNSTSGITHRVSSDGGVVMLYWVVDEHLMRADTQGGAPEDLGLVQLEELALFLRMDLEDETIPVGTMGDIVYHPTRETFWGVDIANDVYFEFDETGALVVDGGRPTYFFNPLRNADLGGAFGNTLDYASVPPAAGTDDPPGEFFDITIGTLSDGRVSKVMRVHATAGPDYAIGDDTGISYELGETLGAPAFPTGIAYWPDFCVPGQHVEVILEVRPDLSAPSMFLVAADAPATANVADFSCSVEEQSVTLSWRKTFPYATLDILRQTFGSAGEPRMVAQFTDFENDPVTFVDADIPDGSYEYIARIGTGDETIEPPSDVTCSVTVGLGMVIAVLPIDPPEEGERRLYAVTTINDTSVAVVDVDTGETMSFDLDLNPVEGTIEGPSEGGLIIGVTFDPTDGSLFWLQDQNGLYTLQQTDANGQPGDNAAAPVETPATLPGIHLAGLAHDEVGDLFWTVDLSNNVIFPILADGSVPQPFGSMQVQMKPGESLAGGIAVALREENLIALDVPLITNGSRPDTMARIAVDVTMTEEPVEIFRFDLESTLNTGDTGGLAIAPEGEEQVEFVLSTAPQALYKLAVGVPSLELGTPFRRGDGNNDDRLNISDPSFILNFLFQDGASPTCMAAADSDGNDTVEITDAIFLFSFLFRGSETAPPEPFVECGTGPEGELPCEEAVCTD